MLRKLRRRRRFRPDPATVAPQWRPHLVRALAARDRLERIVATVPPGPVRDRLRALATELDAGISTLTDAAAQATALAAALPTDLVERHAAELKQARRALADAQEAGRPSAGLESEVALLARRHAAAQRARNQLEDLPDRARLLAVRIETAVTHAAAVALTGGRDLTDAEAGIRAAGEELVALRAALDELRELDELGRPSAAVHPDMQP